MTSTKHRLIVIVGPTGSGKTDLSIRLAQHFHAPILSTDSRQVYRGMAIGTAQPTAEQLAAAEHHFIACMEPTAEFNCGEYERQALQCLERLFETHDTVVAVGGSGLYIKALCEGMDALPDADMALREQIMAQVAAEGLAPLLAELEQRDPAYYNEVDRNNTSRVVRAIEVCRATGRPFSELRTGRKNKRNFSIIKIGVNISRDELYERINGRVDQMIDEGLEQEARTLLLYRNYNALQTVGYTEMFAYFDGKLSREEAIDQLKRNTRHYAKRQMTWFRRDADIRWFSPSDVEPIINYIEEQTAQQ